MTEDVKPITVTIFEKDYLVGCPEEERESLFSAVEYLNDRMNELRENGKVIGTERIAVMAALNLTHEYLDFKRDKDFVSADFGTRIERLQEKITNALSRGRALKMPDAAQPTG